MATQLERGHFHYAKTHPHTHTNNLPPPHTHCTVNTHTHTHSLFILAGFQLFSVHKPIRMELSLVGCIKYCWTKCFAMYQPVFWLATIPRNHSCLPCQCVIVFCHLQRLLDFQQQSLPLLGMRKLFGMLARLAFSSSHDPAMIQVVLQASCGLLCVFTGEDDTE